MIILKSIFGFILGMVVGALVFLPIGFVIETVTDTTPRVLYLCFLVIGGFIGFYRPIKAVMDAQTAAEERVRTNAEAEAKTFMNQKNMVLSRVADIEKKTGQIVSTLSPLLKRAERQLVLAENELKERVFIPFWECIIAATRCFEEYQKNILELTTQSKEHRALLKQVNTLIQARNKVIKSAPSAKLNIEEKSLLIPALPDPSDLVRTMQALVRQAHKDPDFANAYGHIKTHKGLANIGAEVREMSMTLFTAVSQLQNAVTDSLSDIEYRQDVDDFAIKEMLDNIQRRRKPND